MNIYRVSVLDGVLPGWHPVHYRTKKEALKDARREARGAKGFTGEWEVIAHAIKVGTGKDASIDALNSASWGSRGGTEIFYWGGVD